jgi:hypothetical protein
MPFGVTVQQDVIYETLMVELPMSSERAVDVEEVNELAFTVCPFINNCPLLWVIELDVVNASNSVHPPPMPLKTTALLKDFPPQVIVFPVAVASKLTGPEKVKSIPVTNTSEP